MTPLIETVGLAKHFSLGGIFQRERKVVRAVDDVDLKIRSGEILALVGESGSGKSTFGRVIVGLTPPTAGKVIFEGNNLYQGFSNEKATRRQLQIIFQDALASLNPRKTVAETLRQPFEVHTELNGEKLREEVSSLVRMVGLTPPEMFADRYPHELSGGQRQRVVIARAIALRPKFVVADEPVSQLDVSIRAQILKLIVRLQRELKLTYLLISHDLPTIRTIADRVAIMYLGRVVEEGTVEQVFDSPQHPYTQILLGSTPIPDPRLARQRKRIIPKGEPVSAIDVPSGCRFRTRCPYAFEPCISSDPKLIDCGSEHKVACHLTRPGKSESYAA
jgi:oligopeptide/dipeptide ABC transporter ATP-binding protein